MLTIKVIALDITKYKDNFSLSTHFLFSCFSSVASLGIFAVEFIEYFNASTSSVSWIGSILFFMVIPAGLKTTVSYPETVSEYI